MDSEETVKAGFFAYVDFPTNFRFQALLKSTRATRARERLDVPRK